MGYAVPPPPPDVPALKEAAPGAVPKTMREQMEQHRDNPVCASCHKITDPIGFALENFDETGAWRITNQGGAALNTVTELADGAKVDGAAALRSALLREPELFVQTVTQKLIVYALGRGLTAGDMPVVRKAVREAAPGDYRFSDIVLGIVRSVPFQMRTKLAGTVRD